MVTFQEFKKKVYESYKKSLKSQDRSEVDAYFKSDEAEEEMRSQYESLMNSLDAGEIRESVILSDGAGGCAQCLVLMF